MTEHKHEWQIGVLIIEGKDAPEATALCEECDEFMNVDELERRLNATERLSAEQARDIADYYDPELVTDDGCACCADQHEELRAYASALEEENDKPS